MIVVWFALILMLGYLSLIYGFVHRFFIKKKYVMTGVELSFKIH